MKFENGIMKDIKIAYIGGGSRGWAWGLMSDLVSADDIQGKVVLYDINTEAAEANKIIGNKYNNAKGAKSVWEYDVAYSLKDALTGADFVIISILPGTFDEMESDVHLPEEYGIYQSVGDTVGAGGIVRAMRTAPMFEEIGLAIKEYSPEAWVINYTNPMTMCVKTLYRVFPEIKAFGCCHEVFATKKLLLDALKEVTGVEETDRAEAKVNVIGVNHFTWLTKAQYKQYDLFDSYKIFAENHKENGVAELRDDNWINRMFYTTQKVKLDLFLRYGYIAAAGDRHLAEFCPGTWYLNNPETVKDWQFALTTVEWRKHDLKEKLEKSQKLVSGELEPEINNTGEDGVNQIRALLGLCELITNVNIPNVGQIPNLPLGAVVETNATFRANEVRPVFAGNIPNNLYSLIARISGEQEALNDAIAERNVDKIFDVFLADPQMKIPMDKARELFDRMLQNTKEYLKDYNIK